MDLSNIPEDTGHPVTGDHLDEHVNVVPTQEPTGERDGHSSSNMVVSTTPESPQVSPYIMVGPGHHSEMSVASSSGFQPNVNASLPCQVPLPDFGCPCTPADLPNPPQLSAAINSPYVMTGPIHHLAMPLTFSSGFQPNINVVTSLPYDMPSCDFGFPFTPADQLYPQFSTYLNRFSSLQDHQFNPLQNHRINPPQNHRFNPLQPTPVRFPPPAHFGCYSSFRPVTNMNRFCPLTNVNRYSPSHPPPVTFPPPSRANMLSAFCPQPSGFFPQTSFMDTTRMVAPPSPFYEYPKRHPLPSSSPSSSASDSLLSHGSFVSR